MATYLNLFLLEEKVITLIFSAFYSQHGRFVFGPYVTTYYCDILDQVRLILSFSRIPLTCYTGCYSIVKFLSTQPITQMHYELIALKNCD